MSPQTPETIEPEIPPEIRPSDLLYNLDPFDTMIFDATNKLRRDPQYFVPYIEATINNRFSADGKRITYEDRGETFVWWTHEDKTAWEEALVELKKQDPIPPLHWEDGLALAARDHCLDMGLGGYISDVGTDGSTSEERALRYAERS